jgi:hypothetical protein
VLCTKFFHGVLFLSLLFPCDLLYSRKAYAMVFFHPQSVVSNPRWIVLRNTPISISNLYFEEAMSLSFCSVGTQRLMGIMENQMASILSRLCWSNSSFHTHSYPMYNICEAFQEQGRGYRCKRRCWGQSCWDNFATYVEKTDGDPTVIGSRDETSWL